MTCPDNEPAPWHEYANLFPMLEGPELEAFREDVRLAVPVEVLLSAVRQAMVISWATA